MKRVAIMQPTYLPWLGYFGLMQSVDLFIVLDTTQFAKRTWQQRNQVKSMQGPLWLTVPVLSKGKREQLISEVEIDYSQDYPRGHIKTLEMNYRKSPYFEILAPQLFALLGADNKHLSELTINQIRWIKDVLGITTPIRLASEFEARGKRADLLVSLCERVGATSYISPPGSKIYLDESDAFVKSGIALSYFDFNHPEYPQRYGNFLPYMSVIDLLFNCGSEVSAKIIKEGCKINND